VLARRDGPVDQQLIAVSIGGEAEHLDPAAELIQGDSHMDAFVVSVHADDDAVTL
jgi:hypothetical protein